MTEQDLSHGPCEGLAPLYPDQVYDWENPGMHEVTTARVEARTDDLVFPEHPGTNSVIPAAFPPQNVFYERYSSSTCVPLEEVLQSRTKWEHSTISQEV